MPIIQLNNPVFISVTKAGRVNSGGTVGVYEADGTFTSLATIWSDQIKTTELINPVTLDDAGTKEIWYDVKVDIREKTKAGALIRDTLNLDPNASQASVQGFNLAQNGSFEIDSTSDGQPDNWTISPYTGSAIAITSDIVTDGVEALEFNTTAAGTGGGVATSAKFPVTEGSVCSVAWSFYATHATTLNTFLIKWYDEDGAASGTPSTALTMPASGSVPTSWTRYSDSATAPSDATQGEIVLTGISSGGSNLSSKAYFDGILLTNQDTIVDLTLTNPIITDSVNSTSIDAVYDDDTMADDDVNGLSTQQSIKAYVDLNRGVSTTRLSTSSGTAANFVGIPAGVSKIIMSLDSVSTSTTASGIGVTLGDAGGLEATGYASTYMHFTNLTINAHDTTATEFLIINSTVAAALYSGTVTLTLVDSVSDTWVCSSNISSSLASPSAATITQNGVKLLSNTLTQVSLFTSGTYDSGKVNILFE